MESHGLVVVHYLSIPGCRGRIFSILHLVSYFEENIARNITEKEEDPNDRNLNEGDYNEGDLKRGIPMRKIPVMEISRRKFPKMEVYMKNSSD
ncbi:hypothetical protein CEXT_124421 [Caerostris extrusa]|uniref:Uncharacterized protein n=1 Tax=Caerostris extrusa TaxID=172846 RepID=A0AAV4SQZ3_CAEEX|nr:hypothetical protein CEXT_124421 [Caerostris extrusa]